MSNRWGRDCVVTEHRDLQANTMAVDVTGNYILLAGRRYLAIKNLDDETNSLKKFQRQSKYEVGSAEWNPHAVNYHLCAISSNNRIEILSFLGSNACDLQQTHNLNVHTRVVSDLNWHPQDPDILVTCSIDTYIHVWDIKDQRKPCLSLSATAGASQVRWNTLSPNMLATAHDGDVRIWDRRKGNMPVQYIAAHLTKIHGLDWCPYQQNQLATSSQDCTAKIFDYTNPRRAENSLTTNSPVWRARYTPFGEGLVTIVVPQLRRGENSLLLWNTSNLSAPVYTFDGHTDVIFEFQWRHPQSDKHDYELITWSKDQCLRIFKIPPVLKKLCGQVMDDSNSDFTQFSEETNLRTLPSVEDLQLHQSNTEHESNYSSNIDLVALSHQDDYSKTEIEALSPTQPKTLQQEFSLINMNIPNIQVNALDAVERCCTVTASNKSYNVVLKVNFPGNYPYKAQPTFQFCPGTTIDNTIRTKILKVLKQTAQQRVKKNRSCLEPCLRQLITTLEQTCPKENDAENSMLGYHMQHDENFLNSSTICSNYHDAYIPFPRTSGAKFCSVGTLVCFGRSSYARRSSLKFEGLTPRSLSALGSKAGNGSHFIYPNSYVQSNENINSFYFQERMPRRIINVPNKNNQKASCYKNYHSIIKIYDASSLFFVSKELAEKYIINTTDIPAMCQYNANVAASLERPDLVQAWCLAALVISQHHANMQSSTQSICPTSDIDVPWSLHPFGQNLIHSLIQHYANQSDIQMAGMLSCAFSYRSENSDVPLNRFISKSVNVSKLFNGKLWLKPGGSPYHTIHPADTSLEGWNFPNLKQNRSNSWSESLDGIQIHDTGADYGRNIRLLDDKNSALYDAYKKAYAEVLHRWRLLDARAQVLKHVTVTSFDTHKSVEFQSECTVCNKSTKGPQCSTCKRLTVQCVICHISVRGPSNFCIACGHGGHTYHLATWFTNETVCPTGCGCYCLRENMSLLKV